MKNAKDIKEEALESLKAMGVASVEAPRGPPSPAQALLGGIAAGVIALILYKFTTTVEASLNRQSISDNFSVSIIFSDCLYHSSSILLFIVTSTKTILLLQH